MMVEILLALNIACGIAAASVGVVLAIKKKRDKSSICDSCEHLVQKGRGAYKYRCQGGRYETLTDDFDKPPEFCKYYKPREQEELA